MQFLVYPQQLQGLQLGYWMRKAVRVILGLQEQTVKYIFRS